MSQYEEYQVRFNFVLNGGTHREAAEELLEDLKYKQIHVSCLDLYKDGRKVAEVNTEKEEEQVTVVEETREQRYLDSEGMDCPHCGKSGATCVDSGSDGNDMTEKYKCDHCHGTWTDIYELAGVAIHG